MGPRVLAVALLAASAAAAPPAARRSGSAPSSAARRAPLASPNPYGARGPEHVLRRVEWVIDADVTSPLDNGGADLAALVEAGEAGSVAEVVAALNVSGSAYGFARASVAYPSRTGARFPVVAWGCGAQGTCDHPENVAVTDHLASHGFVVVCPYISFEPDLIGHLGLVNSLRFVSDRAADPSSFLHGRVDGARLGVSGFSMGGGRAARGAEAAQRGATMLQPGSVSAVAASHPWGSQGASVSAPLCVVGGRNDRVATYVEAQRLYDAATGPKLLAIAADAPHADGPESERSLGYVTAFLSFHVANQAAAKTHVYDAVLADPGVWRAATASRSGDEPAPPQAQPAALASV